MATTGTFFSFLTQAWNGHTNPRAKKKIKILKILKNLNWRFQDFENDYKYKNWVGITLITTNVGLGSSQKDKLE